MAPQSIHGNFMCTGMPQPFHSNLGVAGLPAYSNPVTAMVAQSSQQPDATEEAPRRRRQRLPTHATPGNSREHLCHHAGCPRSQIGKGFKGRRDNLITHLRLTHREDIPKMRAGRRRGDVHPQFQ
ncbi:hypothetical protein BJ508DRAFT_35749 [Ascobolus immersus RN42]|uniref:C2H2-domain containing protein second zinc finger domain-containing protein n=1 Tax=Ascobolus immersus RN42 TaxID=1160509 RepID=A0A3N4HN59_ASCIM|nr:hypothetical protein BJ508DRAFT_35749 [Ascobolus immersus RN42]